MLMMCDLYWSKSFKLVRSFIATYNHSNYIKEVILQILTYVVLYCIFLPMFYSGNYGLLCCVTGRSHGVCYKKAFHLKKCFRALKSKNSWNSNFVVLSFNVWTRYFVWNFKGSLWNSTQNILPIHWKMCVLCKGQIIRARRCKSS